jgi:hypothetical protein
MNCGLYRTECSSTNWFKRLSGVAKHAQVHKPAASPSLRKVKQAKTSKQAVTIHNVTPVTNIHFWAVPWLRRLVAGLSPRRPGFDPGSVHVGYVVDKVALRQIPPPPPSTSVHVGFVVDKVALAQICPRVLRFSPVNFIPPVLHYLEKWKTIIFITGLHNKPQGCGASVASAAGPFTTTTKSFFGGGVWNNSRRA